MGKIAVERNSNRDWLPPWTRLEHEARYDFAARFVSEKRVIDCACGTGIGAVLFASKGALEVRAIDSSADAVAEARKAGSQSNLQIALGDATRTGLPDGYADLFISLETIEHVEDDVAFIEEAFRVLKPGGIFICSTPNREITNPGTTLADAPWNPYHIREYNLDEFRARLESRFEIQGVYGQNPVHPRYVRVIRLLAEGTRPAWAIKMNKLLKCRWFLLPSPEHHAVRPVLNDTPFEFYVLVCRRP
jgi:SAM-dependent methyltransferase